MIIANARNDARFDQILKIYVSYMTFNFNNKLYFSFFSFFFFWMGNEATSMNGWMATGGNVEKSIGKSNFIHSRKVHSP